jgi:hypothetical protein
LSGRAWPDQVEVAAPESAALRADEDETATAWLGVAGKVIAEIGSDLGGEGEPAVASAGLRRLDEKPSPIGLDERFRNADFAVVEVQAVAS